MEYVRIRDPRPIKARLSALYRDTVSSRLARVAVAAAVAATVLTMWLTHFGAKPHSQLTLWTIAVLFALFAVGLIGFAVDLFNAIVGSFTSRATGGGQLHLPGATKARELARAVVTLPVLIGTMLLWLAIAVFVLGGIAGLLLIGWRAIAS